MPPPKKRRSTEAGKEEISNFSDSESETTSRTTRKNNNNDKDKSQNQSQQNGTGTSVEHDITLMDTEPWEDTPIITNDENDGNNDSDSILSPIIPGEDANNNSNNKSGGKSKSRLRHRRKSEIENLLLESSENNNNSSAAAAGSRINSLSDRTGEGRTTRIGQKRKSAETEEETQDSSGLDSGDDTATNDEDEDDFLTQPSLPTNKTTKKKRISFDAVSTVSTIPRATGRLRKKVGKTKKIQNQRLSETPGICSGIVKNIKMFNFMCHNAFSQDWHPNLNFITGENGSGKSALLSALLIGLGAKAAVTSRTKSMTSLIQRGKDSARTEVTLINNGTLPFDKYGNEIMIERTLSKNGTSTYRLKAGNAEKIRKMKKFELDYILMSFNIQLDNPVAILNQEVAKNFLRTKDPKDKYKLFNEGTLLAKLFELLRDSRNSITISGRNLRFQQDLLSDIKAEVRQLEVKLKEVDNLTNIRKKFQLLGHEYLWAVVNDEEKRKTELEKHIEGHDDKIGKISEKLDSSVEQKRALQDEMQPGQDRTAEIRDKIQQKEREIDDTRRELNSAQKSIQQFKATIRTNRDLVRRKERMLNDVKQTLDRLKSSSEADKEKAIQEYEDNKQALLEDKRRIQEEIISLKRDCNQFINGLDSARAETNNIEDEFKLQTNSYESKKRQLSALQSSGSNKYAIFGRSMETLMSKIAANRNKFSKPPRGPIAALLTVTDPKFVQMVEHILKSKSFCSTFIVNNNADFMLMKKLIQEAYQQNNSSQYGRQSVSANLPSIKMNTFKDTAYEFGQARVPGVSTLFDLLEVEDNDCVIINGLADYVDAERTLMFETNQAAANIMKNASKFPKSTKHAYTLEWYKFLPAPNYAAQAQSTQDATRAQYLKSSKKEQIDGLKAEMDSLLQTINRMKPMLGQKKKAEAELRRQHEGITAEIEVKRRTLNTVERNLKENETKKYREPDVASHEEEVRDLEGELQRITDENNEAEQRIEDGKTKIEGLANKKEDLHLSVDKLQKDIDNGLTNRQGKVAEINKLEQLIARMKTQMSDLRKAKEPTLENYKKSEMEYERKLKQAQESGERVNSRRSASDVKKEVETIKIKIASMEKHIGDSDKLKRDHAKKKENYKKKLKDYYPMYRCYDILRDIIKSQTHFLFQTRISITNGLTYMFTNLARQRGYKGQMLINHETEELHYYICPDQASTNRTNAAVDENDRNKNKGLVEYTCGLSGGERSFSTICFIISLWQVMECPFYMLDEFDVFMDAFNRKASQEALIANAKQQGAKHQFFLFSPLDIVEVPAENEATIIRLRSARPDNDENDSFSRDVESENVDPSRNRSSKQQNQREKTTAKTKSAAMSQKNNGLLKTRREV